MQLWARVPGFECRTSGCETDTGAKIAANLKTDMRASKRIRIFEDESFADLRFVGIITNISSSQSNILGVRTLTVEITTTIQALDFRTSEVIWSGRATGKSEVTNFLVNSSPTLDGALQESSKNAVAAILVAEDLKPYFKHKPGETPAAQGTPNQPAMTAPAAPTVAPAVSSPVTSSAAAPNAQAALNNFVNALRALDFNAINESLLANYYNPLQLKAAIAAADNNKRGFAALITASITPAESIPNTPLSTWDVVYQFPGMPEKLVRLTAFNNTSDQLGPRKGWKVLYFVPESQFRGLTAPGLNFNFGKASEALEGFMGEYHKALGLSLQ
jgi:hypothetical protein